MLYPTHDTIREITISNHKKHDQDYYDQVETYDRILFYCIISCDCRNNRDCKLHVHTVLNIVANDPLIELFI